MAERGENRRQQPATHENAVERFTANAHIYTLALNNHIEAHDERCRASSARCEGDVGLTDTLLTLAAIEGNPHGKKNANT